MARAGPWPLWRFGPYLAVPPPHETRPREVPQSLLESIATVGHNLLLDLPPELLLEIFSYLRPSDLINLCRTTGYLSRTLLSPELWSVWHTARLATYGAKQEEPASFESTHYRPLSWSMPAVPKGMSELQYNWLMFSKECMQCGNQATDEDFFHGTKFCAECWDQNYLTKARAEALYPARLVDLLQDLNAPRKRNEQEARSIFKNYIERELPRYGALESNVDHGRYWHRISQQQEARLEFKNNALRWRGQQIGYHAAIVAEAFRERTASMMLRMEPLGYKFQDLTRDDLLAVAQMDRRTDVTDQEWAVIFPKLEPLAKQARERRLATEAEMRLRLRRHDLDHAIITTRGKDAPFGLELVPTIGEVMTVPQIKALEENDELDRVYPLHWPPVEGLVKDFIHKKRKEFVRSLLHILKGGLEWNGRSEITPEMLRNQLDAIPLKACPMQCTHCNDVVWFNEAPRHMEVYKLNVEVFSPVPDVWKHIISSILRAQGLPEAFPGNQSRQRQTDLFCAACDDRIAEPHVTVQNLVGHWIRDRVWFERATAASREDRETAYPDLPHDQPLPAILDTHDVSSVPLRSTQTPESIMEAQRLFGDKVRADTSDDPNNPANSPVESFDEQLGRVRRLCKLCPQGFAPIPASTLETQIHVQMRHGIRDDKLAFATYKSSDPFPAYPCIG